MRRRTFTVELKPIPGGGYLVTVPALPGCVTQGDTYDHAIDMAQEAIEGYLAILIEDGDPIPDEPEHHEVLAIGVRVAMPAAS